MPSLLRSVARRVGLLLSNLNPILYFLYNDNFGLFKKGVEIVCPFEH